MRIHGSLETTDEGRDLVLARELPVTVDEAWRWVTEPERTEQWYGPWQGERLEGATIEVTMAAEEGRPTSRMRIDACRAPSATARTGHYQLTALAEAPAGWTVGIDVAARASGSMVALRHVGVPDEVPLADLGAGWEFYLDALVAAVENREPLTFEQCQERFGAQYAELA